MTEKLKPCPAGHTETPEIGQIRGAGGTWVMNCGNIACDWQVNAPTRAEAFKAWNTRAEPPRREWVGLTDEELTEMHHIEQFGLFCDADEFKDIARAIESALKRHNT